MPRPTLSRELPPSCVRYAVISGALGARPRTSLNMRLIQPVFVDPASTKYSGDAVICASICSSVIPAPNAGIQKLTSAGKIGRCRNVE